jgi:glycosyltransferase involved in cell wall biosynthesis
MMQLNVEMNITDGSFNYIRNGIDLRSLDKLCSACGSNEPITHKPFLLFGGRLFWSKGVLCLLDLAYILEKKYHLDLQIVIYGSGPMYNRIIQRKNEYRLNNVILKQFSSRTEFLSAMKDAMCVLIPSPFEAAYGILCSDVQDMALKINQLYFGNISASNFEKQIFSFARKNYSIDKTSKAYCAHYKKMINTSI